MKKRGQAKVIVLILLILLAILLLIALWNILSKWIKGNVEISDLKAELMRVNIGIEDTDWEYDIGGTNRLSNVTLTLRRGAEKITRVGDLITEKNADIVFVIDSTGSMASEINDVRDIINNFTTKLAEERGINYNLSLVEFKDYPIPPCGETNDFPSKIHKFNGRDFTKDVSVYSAEIDNLLVTGGRDFPESSLTAITDAIGVIDTNHAPSIFPNITMKFIIVLTDAPPHAEDCIISQWFFGGYIDKNTSYECYTGPKYITDIQQQLVDKGIIFYYINKGYDNKKPSETGLCNDPDKMVDMAYATGGGLYEYTESGGVQDIINNLGTKIADQYEAEQDWDHLKIVFYNATTSWIYKQYAVPNPLETRKYTIPNETGILESYITNLTRIEIYMAVYTTDGKEVLSSALDVINLQ